MPKLNKTCYTNRNRNLGDGFVAVFALQGIYDLKLKCPVVMLSASVVLRFSASFSDDSGQIKPTDKPVLSTFDKTLSFVHIVRYLRTISISETGQHQMSLKRNKQVSLSLRTTGQQDISI